MLRVSVAGCVAIVCALFSTPAAADLTDDINKLRREGCNNRRGVETRLQPSRELDEVARQWSRGGRLQDALTRANYRAVNSASMHVEGATNDQMLLRVLAQHYCQTITDPTFTTIGIARRAKDVHIVVALPFSAPTSSDAKAIAQRVLTLVNEARAKGRTCGKQRFAAVPALTASATLTQVALAHAQDMAKNDFFEHQGSDGSTAAVRATRFDYQWRSIAENIAAGATTADTVVAGWLNSPGHCANIMGASFKEMGVAYATNPKSDAGIYWAQVFGSRRE